MLYYRVKADLDGQPVFKYVGHSTKLKAVGQFVGGELYTPGERQKIANADKYFEKVQISQRNTYWLFGARFEKEGVFVI